MIGRRTLSLLAVVAVAACILSVVSTAEDSDADASGFRQWYVYGYSFAVHDENYDSKIYDSIEWRYADTPEGLSTAKPVTEAELKIRLDPKQYPLWGTYPVFVREDATVNGDAKRSSLVVNVNPIKDSCYVLFMYDDTKGYRYVQVTTHTVVKDGQYVAEPPADPGRDGYVFKGWFTDKACTVPYTQSTRIAFTEDRTEVRIYPKWEPAGSPAPTPSDVFGVTVHPVPGLDIGVESMVVRPGMTFSFDVSVTDRFRFDLSGLTAVTDRGQELEHVSVGGIHTFTLRGVDRNTEVFLSGFVQYYRVVTDLKDVTTVGYEEWIRGGSPLELPLRSDSGEVVASVYMSDSDITGTSFIDGKVRISEVTGDVYISAHAGERAGQSIPWIMWAVIAGLSAALIVALIAYKRKRA